MSVDRKNARALAREHLARGDALGWFERLYHEAAGDWSRVPWADLRPNPQLTEWLADERRPAPGARALVVGCGLGDDAQALADAGHAVVAFDVAPTAIEAARRRHPGASVRWEVADALAPPAAWTGAFDLVFESYTLQVLPPRERAQAARALAALVAPGGRLLVLCRGREPDDPPGEMPWPLLRAEVEAFARLGLASVSFEDLLDREQPPVRRFRALFARPRSGDTE